MFGNNAAVYLVGDLGADIAHEGIAAQFIDFGIFYPGLRPLVGFVVDEDGHGVKILVHKRIGNPETLAWVYRA